MWFFLYLSIFSKKTIKNFNNEIFRIIQYNIIAKLSVYMTFYLELETLVHDVFFNKAMSIFDYKKV